MCFIDKLQGSSESVQIFREDERDTMQSMKAFLSANLAFMWYTPLPQTRLCWASLCAVTFVCILCGEDVTYINLV
jgi:hypothetical protein